MPDYYLYDKGRGPNCSKLTGTELFLSIQTIRLDYSKQDFMFNLQFYY